MNCTSYTLSGLNAGCKDSVGGVKMIFLAPFEANCYEELYGCAKMVSISERDFVLYRLRKGSASMTSTLVVNDNAGNYFTTEIVINFLKMETAKRLEVMAMLMGLTTAIVLDNNGKYWVVGFNNPLEGSAGTGETGTATTDANLYSVTLSVEEAELPFELDDGDIDSIKEYFNL